MKAKRSRSTEHLCLITAKLRGAAWKEVLLSAVRCGLWSSYITGCLTARLKLCFHIRKRWSVALGSYSFPTWKSSRHPYLLFLQRWDNIAGHVWGHNPLSFHNRITVMADDASMLFDVHPPCRSRCSGDSGMLKTTIYSFVGSLSHCWERLAFIVIDL